MLITLALKNIFSQKTRSLLTIITLTICSLSLIIFLSFLNGLNQNSQNTLENQTPLNQITAFKSSQNTGIISILSQNSGIDQDTITKISQIKGITTIYPETQFPHFSSISAQLGNITLQTDAMLFGLPAEKLQINPENWNLNQEPYPAILPRKFLDLYNLTIARPQNLPTFKEENLLQKTLTITPGKSLLLGNTPTNNTTYRVKIIGFSDQTTLIGITLPPQFITKLNQEILQSQETLISQIHIQTESEEIVPQVAAEIEKLNLSTSYLQKNLQKVQSQFIYLQIALSVISFTIILITLIAISNIFLAQINERKKEIGILRALGASKKQIKQIILTEGTTLATSSILTATIISAPLTKYFNHLIQNEFSNINFLSTPVFLISPQIIIQSASLILLITALSLYIPIKKASALSPIDSIRN